MHGDTMQWNKSWNKGSFNSQYKILSSENAKQGIKQHKMMLAQFQSYISKET